MYICFVLFFVWWIKQNKKEKKERKKNPGEKNFDLILGNIKKNTNHTSNSLLFTKTKMRNPYFYCSSDGGGGGGGGTALYAGFLSSSGGGGGGGCCCWYEPSTGAAFAEGWPVAEVALLYP